MFSSLCLCWKKSQASCVESCLKFQGTKLISKHIIVTFNYYQCHIMIVQHICWWIMYVGVKWVKYHLRPLPPLKHVPMMWPVSQDLVDINLIDLLLGRNGTGQDTKGQCNNRQTGLRPAFLRFSQVVSLIIALTLCRRSTSNLFLP